MVHLAGRLGNGGAKSRRRPLPRVVLAPQVACFALLLVAGSARAQNAGAGTPADSQTPPEVVTLNEVVVTGSRIRGAEAVGSNVLTITATDIAIAGRTTSTDLLRLVPQVSNIGADDSRTTGPQRAVSNSYSASAINLRGAGTEATLTLLDGRRPGREESGRFFDMNTIPSIALQRVEVIADGASAIYGSDAVAGVVNLVPFHSYDGLTARLSRGSANRTQQNTISVLGGRTWSRGNVVFAFERYQRDNLPASARPLAFDDRLNTAGAIGTSTNAFPGNLTVAGVLRPVIDSSGDGRLSLAEYTAAAGRPPNRLSSWTGVDTLPEQKRDSLFAYFELEAAERLKIYGQGHVSKRDFVRFTAAPTATLTIPATNYYNQTGLSLSVPYSFINDFGPSRVDGYAKPRQITLGLKYDLGRKWQAETYFTDAKADSFRLGINVINTAALTGSGVLSDTTTAALSPFGGPNQAATLAKVAGYSDNNLVFSMRNAALKADGPLFELPAGDVRMATGVEYIREVRESTNNNTTAGANVSTVVVAAYPTVTRTVKSAFVEVLVPIVSTRNEMRGAKLLSLSIAGRNDSYLDTMPGVTQLDTSTFNPKFGLTWQPATWLRVRGSSGKSFRAASLGDYVLGPPTSSAAGAFSGMPHAAALPLPAGPVNAVAIQGGRSDGTLTPERAKTTSLGVDLMPSGPQGLNLSLTYYKLTYKNQIVSAVDANSLNNAAYANAAAAAGLITFNPTTAQVLSYLNYGGFPFTTVIGPLNVYGTASGPSAGRTIPVAVLMDLRSVNAGVVETDGLDFTLRYSWQTDWGTWRIADSSSYVSSFKQSLLAGTPSTEYLNTYGYPVRFRTRAQLGFEKGGANVNVFVNYVDSYTNTQVSPSASVAANTVADLNVGYSFGERKQEGGPGRYSVQLNVQNLFDRKPPYALVGNPPQTFDSQHSSVMGRLVTLSVEARL